MLTLTGTLAKIEKKPWKNATTEGKFTTYLYVSDHGFTERYELDYRQDLDAIENLVGRPIEAAVRVFNSFDEKYNVVRTRVVAFEVTGHSLAHAA